MKKNITYRKGENMKLFEIRFRHYSQKDSREGILTYLLAQSDEKVYEWIRSEPTLHNDKSIYVGWMYKDDPYEEDEYEEDFKERLIGCCGDMYDDDSEVSDLYYGATQYGWSRICDEFSYDEYLNLKRIGIPTEEFQ